MGICVFSHLDLSQLSCLGGGKENYPCTTRHQHGHGQKDANELTYADMKKGGIMVLKVLAARKNNSCRVLGKNREGPIELPKVK